VAELLVNQFGVLIVPGKYFAADNDESLSDYFRIGFGRANFPEALAAFEQAIAQL
jgi:aspartate/methionine/tyrosine aminotransferase